ncbi:MAG: hypothetical protein ACE5KF_10200 [Kiloniellaceae bacterium]
MGALRIADPVIPASTSGVTDMPFRSLDKRRGAALSVSEMSAGPAMVRGCPAPQIDPMAA